ncbi:MAG TPA: hypothetical protein VGK73_19045 [Polyangiaceae bacterium]
MRAPNGARLLTCLVGFAVLGGCADSKPERDGGEAGDSGVSGGSAGTNGVPGGSAGTLSGPDSGGTSGSGGTSSAGSSGSSAAGMSSAGTSTSGGASGNASGGASAGGSSAGGSGADGGSSYFGQMFVYAPALRDVAGSFSAKFGAPGRQVTEECATTEYGECTLWQCPTDREIVPSEGVPHAGRLTFESSAIGLLSQLEPDGNGVYEAHDLPAGRELFLGEELTRFSAEGGDVPAFSAEVEFPLLLLLDEPPTIQGGAAISQTSDLTLAWSRGLDDIDFLFQVSAVDTLTSANLLCQVPSTLATLTVPAAALQRFPKQASIVLATLRHRTVTAGDYAVELWLGAEVRSPDKAYNIDLNF